MCISGHHRWRSRKHRCVCVFVWEHAFCPMQKCEKRDPFEILSFMHHAMIEIENKSTVLCRFIAEGKISRSILNINVHIVLIEAAESINLQRRSVTGAS